MTTVGDDLDRVRAYLHDGGAVWTDAELLRAYTDAYRELLARGGLVRQFRTLDLPGRHTYAITFEWEDRYTAGGTVRKPTRTALAAAKQATGLWEVQALADVTPTDALDGHTYEWERGYTGDSDHHYRFVFPQNHQRVVALYWQDQRLEPVAVRDLDAFDDAWFRRVGEPRFFTTGVGRVRSVEVFEIRTDYGLAYHLIDAEAGVPRGFDGARTWTVGGDLTPAGWAYTTAGDVAHLTATPTLPGAGVRVTTAADDASKGDGLHAWEVEVLNGATPTTDSTTIGTADFEEAFGASRLAVGLGVPRRVVSPDRMYWPVVDEGGLEPLLGTIRVWGSSTDAILLLETVIPDLALTEEDAPALIPSAFRKYLRARVLAYAFGREGEGRSTQLRDAWLRIFERGVSLAQAITDIAHRDRTWQREPAAPVSSRPPRVRLPATFERVR